MKIKNLLIKLNLLIPRFFKYSWNSEWILPIVGYVIFSLLITWPLIRNFSTAILGVDETRHNLWVLWHVTQSLEQGEGLFQTHLLYYPLGISLLIHSSGPLLGFLTLPFELVGPAAVYNAALLTSFSLSGYFMYLLARDFGVSRLAAWFAGGVYIAAPVHTVFLYVGHLGQMFVGTLPLTLWAFNRALDLKRSYRWAFLPGIVLLATLLDAGWNFIGAILGAAVFVGTMLLFRSYELSEKFVRRCLLVGIVILILTGPLLFVTVKASHNPAIPTSRNLSSSAYHPDLVQMFIPMSSTSRFIGPWFTEVIAPYLSGMGHEMYIFVPWTCWLLLGLGVFKGGKSTWRWLLLTLVFCSLALGTTLKVLGKTTFTDYGLPIILPYAFLSSLPVFDVIRTPGRFMQMAYVGITLLAGLGMTWLRSWLPRRWRYVLPIFLMALTFFEVWPTTFPQEPLREIPDFYRKIAQDKESYGVFDLPIRPYLEREFHSSYIHYSAYYQMYQMVHGKGIATGYISRQYAVHPLFGHFISDQITEFPLQSNVFVNGIPSSRYANLEYELAKYNYRYVVFHKPQEGYKEYHSGSWGETESLELLREVFGSRTPIVDDNLTTVYEVAPPCAVEDLTPAIALRDAESWSASPATFYMASPMTDSAFLEVTLTSLQVAESGQLTDHGWIALQSADGAWSMSPVTIGVPVTMPLLLSAGSQIVTMTVTSGAWWEDGVAPTALNMAIGRVNLRGNFSIPVPDRTLLYTEGWHGAEIWDSTQRSWRWAMSPAHISIYSAEGAHLRLRSVVGAVYDPTRENGAGTQGNLLVSVNGSVPEPVSVQVGQPFEMDLALRPGENTLSFELEAGNFRPADIQPGNGDLRWLSFNLQEFELVDP